MKKIESANAPSNLLDELIAEGIGDAEEDEYTFVASTGRIFRARRIRESDELRKVYGKAKQLAARTTGNTPAQWHEYLPISEDKARSIAFTSACLIEPKITQLELLKLAARAGSYFLEISGKVTVECLLAHVEEDEAKIEDFLDD